VAVRGEEKEVEMNLRALCLLAVPALVFSCTRGDQAGVGETGERKREEATVEKAEEAKERMEVTSSAFEEGGMIPKKYTADGPNVSPPLEWKSAPEGVKSFALICDDPDAPVGTWVHWVLYNLPAETTSLPEGVPAKETLESGGAHGKNDFRKFGYGGPAPPSGTHRYYFKLYALDAKLDLQAGATKADLIKAMEGRVLAEGSLMGRYKR
jgi:Raf kinase inhibitor-like YbhB/YbcL family protein